MSLESAVSYNVRVKNFFSKLIINNLKAKETLVLTITRFSSAANKKGGEFRRQRQSQKRGHAV